MNLKECETLDDVINAWYSDSIKISDRDAFERAYELGVRDAIQKYPIPTYTGPERRKLTRGGEPDKRVPHVEEV